MRFFEVLKGELKLVFSDTALLLTIFGGIILYSFLYPQPYKHESVYKLPVSVVDYDKTEASRELIFKLGATPQIDIVQKDLSKEDALEALVREKVKGVIVIPAHYSRDLRLGDAPTVALGVDNSYFLIYGALMEATLKSVMHEAAKTKATKLLIKGVPVAGLKERVEAFHLETLSLFNRYSSYIEYVLPAVFVLILQQTLLIGMGMLGGGINERMQRGEDGYYLYAKPLQMIVSRYLIFGVIYLFNMLYYFGFIFDLYGVSHLADRGELLAFGVLFLSASIGLGLFLGALFKEREIATPTILFSSMPLIFSVGFIWPREAMPEFINTLALIFPSTPGIDGFLKLNQMGASLSDLESESLILLTQTVVYTILGYYFMKKNQKAYNGKI
jgi:ABC-2 type transport system permease protein